MNMMILLGLAYCKPGDHGKAARIIEQCMERPDVPPGSYDHHALGVVYFVQGDLERAKSSFMREIAEDARVVDSHYYLGLVHERQGALPRARTCFNEALQCFNSVGSGHSLRRFCYPVQRQDVMEALARVGKG